jgi:hypothetical protein
MPIPLPLDTPILLERTCGDVKVRFSPVLPHIFPNPEPDLRVQFRPPLELRT